MTARYHRTQPPHLRGVPFATPEADTADKIVGRVLCVILVALIIGLALL